MNSCFSSEHYLNLFTTFLKYKETIIFSMVNKSLYSILNPENNSTINSKYRDISFKIYYNKNNKKKFEANGSDNLDDYKKTKNNWKKILKELYNNSKRFSDTNISQEIYNDLKLHCYLPYQRIQNNIVEYEFSSLHQTFCYDIKRNYLINKNYYDKFFCNDEDVKIVPLKQGQFFEQELINYKNEIKSIENKKIIEMIMNYSYEKLECIYCSNFCKQKKSKKGKLKYSKIIYFLLWLNHTFIIFINLLFNYVSQFRYFHDAKTLIVEYSKTHNDLINFGLMVNEKFNNINIMFNCLYRTEKDNIPIYPNFSIYNMFMNIMENNFYRKLKSFLNESISKIIYLAYKENIEQEKLNNTYDSNNNETNNTEIVNEENEIDDYYLYDDVLEDAGNQYGKDDDDDGDEESNIDDMTYKNILDEYSNLILDFSINLENCFFINSSKIKLNDYYDEYENLLFENFVKLFKNENEKSSDEEKINFLHDIFLLTKKLTGKDGEGKYHLINRTKLNLIKKCEEEIDNYLTKIINKDLIEKLKNKKITHEQKKNINKDNILMINISFSSSFQTKQCNDNLVYDSYSNKLKEIKKNIIDNVKYININDDKINKNDLEEIIDEYFFSTTKSNSLISLSKDIILFLYSQMYAFQGEDHKIFDSLFKKEEKKDIKLI